MFNDAEEMIHEAVSIAQKQLNLSRNDAAQLKTDIHELERKIGSYLPLLADPDIEALTKKAVGRQIADLQAKQDTLCQTLEKIGDDQGRNQQNLVDSIREAFSEAKELYLERASHTQQNRLVAAVIGPMCLLPDGNVVQKSTTAQEDGRVTDNIAGGGFEPPTSGL